MTAMIRAIGTAVPPTRLAQDRVAAMFAGQPGTSRLAARLIGAAFGGSAVASRGTVLPELDVGAPDAVAADAGGAGSAGRTTSTTSASATSTTTSVFVDPDGVIRSPSTGTRNDRYRELAIPLFIAAARDALARSGLHADAVTHVVTVSCTGFTQPGPDIAVVDALGIAPTVHRHHVGFMGCSAAFPALRIAAAFCEADPDAVVLVVCAELCTLHVRTSADADQIVANSVFSDGAAAAIVTASGAIVPTDAGAPRDPSAGPADDAAGAAPALPGDEHGATATATATDESGATATDEPGATALRIDGFASTVIPEGATDMAWNIGDEGFEMILSTRVPALIEQAVEAAVAPVLAVTGSAPTDVPLWAVHPGGRAIVDRVEERLGLPASSVAASRAVLRDHGNMSSATVLFVLDRMLRDGAGPGTPIVAMAFGPGLTVETAALRVVGR